MKRQAEGGQYQFGWAVLEARAGGSATPGGRVTPVTIDELEGYFDSLATAATTGKTMLDYLVKINSTLTSSIAELAATKTRLIKEVASLSQEVNKYNRGGQYLNDRRGYSDKYCPNCKRDTWHEPDECFELEKNAHKRHSRWKSCVKWRCGATRVEVATNINNNINRSNLKIPIFSSTLINLALQSNKLSPHKNNIAEKWRRKLANRAVIKNSKKDVAIVDSGAIGIYLMPESPKK